jgi:hypothetical protein
MKFDLINALAAYCSSDNQSAGVLQQSICAKFETYQAQQIKNDEGYSFEQPISMG